MEDNLDLESNERGKLEKFILFTAPITLIGEGFGAFFGYKAQGVDGMYLGIYTGALIACAFGGAARIWDLCFWDRGENY